MSIQKLEQATCGRDIQLIYDVPVTLNVRVAAGQERDAVDFVTALAYLGITLAHESGHQEEACRMAHVANVSIPFEIGNPEFVKLGCRKDPVKVFGYAVDAISELEFDQSEVAVGN